jgi:cell wall-associated NlpC family hydrolase
LVDTAAERRALLSEAHEWLGTPYHSCARVKGAGADCLTFVAGVFENTGLTGPIEIPAYNPEWHVHGDGEELYIGGLKRYCAEVSGPPEPGDVVVWKILKCFSHGAIVVEWPRIIHAHVRRNLNYDDALASKGLAFVAERGPDFGKPRPVKFFRLNRWLSEDK